MKSNDEKCINALKQTPDESNKSSIWEVMMFCEELLDSTRRNMEHLIKKESEGEI